MWDAQGNLMVRGRGLGETLFNNEDGLFKMGDGSIVLFVMGDIYAFLSSPYCSVHLGACRRTDHLPNFDTVQSNIHTLLRFLS